MNRLLSCLVAAESMSIAVRHRIAAEVLAAGYRGVTADQALILHRIGDQRYTISDLTTFGFYRGANVTYSVKRMAEDGYVTKTPSSHDRRIIFVQATTQGLRVGEIVQESLDRYVEDLAKAGIVSLDEAAAAIREIERGLGLIPRPAPAW